jgi:hypothetical protein
MLKHDSSAPGAAHPGSDQGSELMCSTLVVRTVLQASATLAHMSREPTLRALEGEAEHLAATDIGAAERAMTSLLQVAESLKRALTDARLTQSISSAIVRAAQNLPGTAAEEAA